MAARERILVVAERLIAERGPQIPLREIAVEAGQRNNSAVHYHFGSRDELIQVIVQRRMAALETRQLELLAAYEQRVPTDDVPGLLHVLVRPLFHVPYEQGATHYARFLEQIRVHPVISAAKFDLEHWPTVRMLVTRLGRVLHASYGFPVERTRGRLTSMSTVLFALLADWERDSEVTEAESAAPVDETIDMLVGLLTARGQ